MKALDELVLSAKSGEDDKAADGSPLLDIRYGHKVADFSGGIEVSPEMRPHLNAQGSLTSWFYRKFEAKRERGIMLPVVSEFSTLPELDTMSLMVTENYCVNKSTEGTYPERVQRGCPRHAESIKKRFRDGFNPPDAKWQDKLLKNAEILCRMSSQFGARR